MRNPRLVPPGELRPNTEGVELGPDGEPVNVADAENATYEVFAKLIIGWRVYDASVMEINPETGEPLDQPLLDLPVTAEKVGKLPGEIIKRIRDEFMAAINPQ